MLTSIFPGPKEQSGDQVQRCLRPIVNDLYELWKNGVSIRTPSCRDGESKYFPLWQRHVETRYPLSTSHPGSPRRCGL